MTKESKDRLHLDFPVSYIPLEIMFLYHRFLHSPFTAKWRVLKFIESCYNKECLEVDLKDRVTK